MNIRYDLMPELGLLEVHKVLSSKLEKHSKNEWCQGISWSDIISNLEKHLSAFKRGEDYYGDEANLLNIAAVAEEALLLCEAYTKFPHFDDRQIISATKPIICCDLDDCIFDFIGAFEKKFGITLSDYWKGSYEMGSKLDELTKDKDFWVNLPLKNRPQCEIDYYVTARSIPVEWTEEAIEKHNLPKAKVISLPWNVSKIPTLQSIGCQIMVDDKYETFKECTNAGIFCYLMDTPANRYYNVGHRRIYDLNLKF